MIRRFLATKPKFGSSTAPPTVPVKGFFLILADSYAKFLDQNTRSVEIIAHFLVYLMKLVFLKWSFIGHGRN